MMFFWSLVIEHSCGSCRPLFDALKSSWVVHYYCHKPPDFRSVPPPWWRDDGCWSYSSVCHTGLCTSDISKRSSRALVCSLLFSQCLMKANTKQEKNGLLRLHSGVCARVFYWEFYWSTTQIHKRGRELVLSGAEIMKQMKIAGRSLLKCVHTVSTVTWK